MPSRGKSVVAGERHANRQARCRALARVPSRARVAVAQEASARRRRTRRRSDRATRRVVSSVASPGPLDTRLPSVTMARPTRPSIGEVTRVNSRFSSAARSAASTAATCAVDSCANDGAALVLLVRHRVLGGAAARRAAARSRRAAPSARARASSARRRSTSAWNGRGSIWNSRSPRCGRWRLRRSARPTTKPGDARPDRHGVHGFEPAGELVPLGDVAGDDFRDRDLRRRRLGRLRRGARAGRGSEADDASASESEERRSGERASDGRC